MPSDASSRSLAIPATTSAELAGRPLRVSIVTPSLNRAGMIEQAILSVLSQGIEDLEHLVIDGGSTDGTLEVLARYPHLRVVSERDRNLYEAINKGIRLASGDVIGLVNTDDRLPPGALRAVVDIFRRREDAGIVAGAADIVQQDAAGRMVRRRFDDERIIRLDARKAITGLTLTNARFFRRWVFDAIGPFDERFPVMSDREFLLRAALSPIPVAVTRQVLYEYTAHAASLSFASPGASEALARDSLELAQTCLAGAQDPPATMIFRRWHAWSTGYYAALLLRRGRMRDGFHIFRNAFERDVFWPLRFTLMALMHLLEAPMRRGRAIEQT